MDPERWRRIEDLYHSALELKPERRESFLRTACAGDQSLRKEIERLLERESEAGVFIESPAIEVAARALAEDAGSASGSDLAASALSHYRILEKLGSGGMGVVYRARDENLGRYVAIKVLPDVFAGDPDRLARFSREAKLLAAINHPNIAAIHGLEEFSGRPVLIMELVEGETLAARISRGNMTICEALDICRQIAEGVEAAHEKGIIHRDLKPANVMLTDGGQIKILDFGLAKAAAAAEGRERATGSLEGTDSMTGPGTLLGTAAYMSPEQARGKQVDKRCDIWSFGCILFECLTGKPPFKGETVSDTVARILETAPEWNLLPAQTPPLVRTLLQWCLQKEAASRVHDIADARLAITEALAQAPVAATVPDTTAKRPRMWSAVAVAAAVVVAAAAGAITARRLKSVPAPPVVTSVLKVEPGFWLEGWRLRLDFERPSLTSMAISSSGRFVVYSAIKENPESKSQPRLYLRQLGQDHATPIPGTEGAIAPFLSPDDKWIGYWKAPESGEGKGRLMKVAVDGGVPLPMCETGRPFGASWGSDNTIVFAPTARSELMRVSADGGTPGPLPLDIHGICRLPHYLPDARGVLFTVMRHEVDPQPRIYALDLTSGNLTSVMDDAADGYYLPTGQLVFIRQGELMAAGFDAVHLKPTGPPFLIGRNVMQALNSVNAGYNTAAGQYSVSASGILIYVPGGIRAPYEYSLVKVDHKGNLTPFVPFKAPFMAPRISPDSKRIVYNTFGKEWRIWIYDIDRHVPAALPGEGEYRYPAWRSDDSVAFAGWIEGAWNLYGQPADGSALMKRLTLGPHDRFPESFTPDGSALAFVDKSPPSEYDVFLLNMQTGKVAPRLNAGKTFEAFPEISPDGHWLAYVSRESGPDKVNQVYVTTFPQPGRVIRISPEGGMEPVWSRTGKQLFYLQGDTESPSGNVTWIWKVEFTSDSGFLPGRAKRLFRLPNIVRSTPVRGWDVFPDGQSFLMRHMEQVQPQPVTEMILVQNWFEELRRPSSTGK